MALKATIFKADMQINDSCRNYYDFHSLTVAQHPSETDERLMIRLSAFAFFADENLKFTKGLSAEDEPEIWIKDLSGGIRLWVEFGQPDERRIKKACGKSDHVAVICYGRTGQPWWEKTKAKLDLMDNLSVYYFNVDDTEVLKSMVSRTMNMQFSIDDSYIYLTCNDKTAGIEIESWKDAAADM
ncbi:MAG: YaeQ family protein [Spirochaetes bacterium]|nr:YaeQ family protein [Spirochaetota bacterium]